MTRILFITLFIAAGALTAFAQRNQGAIKVSPSGVNVNTNGATTVLLTFGGVTDKYRPAEATWCGGLTSAAPDNGFKCVQETVCGFLPDRFDLSRKSGQRSFTDVMTIPPSIARRAYQAAQAAGLSVFFYVRHFVNESGGPDEYVVVTCRLAGGGVSTPLALTNVKLSFGNNQPLLAVKPGQPVPPLKAELTYNGTGRLIGRWEVVLPGDPLPEERDLLTEASLPPDERAHQRRYTLVQRFNTFLPPTGKETLTLTDTTRLPTGIEGQYQVLLRVEASEDQDGGSNLSAVGAGAGFIQSGAVAGFALPVLRYYVGNGGNEGMKSSVTGAFALLSPVEAGVLTTEQALVFSWSEHPQAAFYRLEVLAAGEPDAAQAAATATQPAPVLSAIQRRGNRLYRAPVWLQERAPGGQFRWRVVALDQAGQPLGESVWRGFQWLPVRAQ